MNWPDDADGDALRRLEKQGFDFTKLCQIDFSVDFDEWPPPTEAIELLKKAYPDAIVREEQDEEGGYVLIQIFDLLNYEFVVRTQSELSKMMASFGGICESWGVLH